MSLDDIAAPATPDASTPSPTSTSEAAPAAPETSLDDDLAKVWETAQARGDDDTPEAPTAQERDENGRFRSAKPPTDEVQPAPEQAADEQAGQPEPQAPVAEQSAIEAPRWWSAELQASFAKLPPEVAKPLAEAALNDRQNISKLGNALQAYEPLNRVLNEHRAEFESAGVNPVDGLRQLLRVQQELMNPATRGNVYRYLLQNYPADLGQALDGLPPDPQMSALEQRLQQTEARLRQYEARDQEAQQTRESERQAAALREIEQAEKTLPDFATLMSDIMLMLPVLKQQNPNLSHAEALKLAHERAGWANPTVRQKWEEAAVQKRMKAAAEAADKAKRQNGLNVSSKQKPATPAELEDALGSVWDKHHAA